MKKPYSFKRRITVIACITVFLFAAFYNGLITKTYRLSSEKIEAPVKIVVITDLHSHVYGKNQRDIITRITKQSPDIILLVGDIIDDIEPVEGAKIFLENVVKICPTYYVTGNHEFWSRNIKGCRDIVEKNGIMVLSDEYREIELNGNKIIVAGIDDPAKTYYEDNNYDQLTSMKNAFSKIRGNTAYKILLAHRPEYIEAYNLFDFDLVVSGHAHGGQIRIPFIVNGLFAPNQGLFPKYAGGVYRHGPLTHIVSRGVSINYKLPRIFNPPEITVIELSGRKK